MSGFLDTFREKVFRSIWKEDVQNEPKEALNDKIALGVLLWEVAQADARFLPEERQKIEDVLKEYASMAEEDLPVVMQSIQQASQEKIDLYAFTHEVSEDLSFEARQEILEHLFRVACSDQELSAEEEAVIRKISGLFRLDHKDFIESKIKVKKEFGLETVS